MYVFENEKIICIYNKVGLIVIIRIVMNYDELNRYV